MERIVKRISVDLLLGALGKAYDAGIDARGPLGKIIDELRGGAYDEPGAVVDTVSTWEGDVVITSRSGGVAIGWPKAGVTVVTQDQAVALGRALLIAALP